LRPNPADGVHAPARTRFPTKQNQRDRFGVIYPERLTDRSWPVAAAANRSAEDKRNAMAC